MDDMNDCIVAKTVASEMMKGLRIEEEDGVHVIIILVQVMFDPVRQECSSRG